MSHKRLVIFTDKNAYVLKNPPDYDDLIQQPNVLQDPDLGAVRGIFPHYWKCEEGKVMPMTIDERKVRDGLLKKAIPVYTPQAKPPSNCALYWFLLLSFSLGMAVPIGMYFAFHR